MYNNNGSENTAIGYKTLYSNTLGGANTAVGGQALRDNLMGEHNTANGYLALLNNTSGSHNTAMGSRALISNTTAGGNIAIGDQALYNQSFSNNSTPFNSDNVAIGVKALTNNNPTLFSDFFGTGNGIWNTAIGNYAMASNTTGYSNTAVGLNALYHNINGSDNTAIGISALFNNQDGFGNIAIGRYALFNNILGNTNTAIGYNADNDVSTSSNNTIVGANAHISNNASTSTVIGYGATTNINNVIVLGTLGTAQIGGYATWSIFSDGRFKTNVNEDVKGIDFIMRLRPVTYHMNVRELYKFWGTSPYNNGKETPDAKTVSFIDDAITKKEAITMTGFIAQEVEKAAIESHYNFDGVIKPQHDKDHYRIAYEEFVVPLVKAVQEQQQIIEDLKKEMAEMKKEWDIQKMKKRN